MFRTMWSDIISKCIIVVGLLVILFTTEICSCPDIISRDGWNASKPHSILKLKEDPPPYIVVHHSATNTCNSDEQCVNLVKGIQNYHMVNQGWEDIGYNFLIGGNGNIYEGRGWGIHGAHVPKYNRRSVGICLLGNFQIDVPPKVQLEALNHLIACAKETNKTTMDYHLIGHRQGSNTLCPGDNLFAIIQTWPHFDPNPN